MGKPVIRSYNRLPVKSLPAALLSLWLALAYLLFVFMREGGPQLFFLLFAERGLENGSLVP